MAYVAAIIAVVAAVAAIYMVATMPQAKNTDPVATTLSEFGTPVISQAQTKRVLMGNKWVTDPLVADYGNYSASPVWHNP